MSSLAFAKVRYEGRPVKYATVRIAGILINIGLTVFFLSACPAIQKSDPNGFIGTWGNQKVIYYLGGVDGWLKLRENENIDVNTGTHSYRYFNPSPAPDPDADYAYQALAVNLRGFKQNVANGNNNLIINSEIRMPVFTTLFNRPINNAFVRNFQLVQFVDLGTACNQADGTYRSDYIRQVEANIFREG